MRQIPVPKNANDRIIQRTTEMKNIKNVNSVQDFLNFFL